MLLKLDQKAWCQLDTPMTFRTEALFSPVLIMKSATSAREMLKPKLDGLPVPDTCRFEVCWSVYVGEPSSNRVRSFRKTFSISVASRTMSGKNKRPTRRVGGMTESLKRKAVDSTTTRRIPALA